ncbi:MarR family winged helix-turn-helix transcriptional regulator [Phytohabitans houttuyneae]|uniref:MarR family transcriptional regulator n=1 Tax=Phytohabitans houttuyneae TaxID=1076126 RepID=A0A6V8KG05_9ACTN|nr:MarR family transcriptional regulator [Phytohabitans houttuyneae]GFJ81308.1 MarR family transcriptional regulator [Phytohabitans houttuyneae]
MDQARGSANVGYLVWRLSNRWRAATDRLLADHGLTHAQYAALASLHGLSVGGTRPSQRELADFTGLEPVYISKLVRSLEQSGFITRAVHPADTRAIELSLTDRGREVVAAAMPKVQEQVDRFTQPLGGTGGAGTQRLIATLQKLLDHEPSA